MEGGPIDVALELVPAMHRFDLDGVCTLDRDGASGMYRDGYWELAIGDRYFLKLKNYGEHTVHVAILSLKPDGQIGQLAPYTAREIKLSSGQEMLLERLCLKTTPPPGMEVLKLFATREPIDFRPMLDDMAPRGEGQGRGAFEVLFEDVNTGTGSRVRAVWPALGGTSEVLIRVVAGQSLITE